MSTRNNNISFGLELDSLDPSTLLEFAKSNSFSFTASNIRCSQSASPGFAFSPNEMNLTIKDEPSFHLAKVSQSLDISSKNERSRRDSEALVKQECEWSSFLGMSVILFPTPTTEVKNYARFINAQLSRLPSYVNIWIRIKGDLESWNSWNSIRLFCANNPRIGVAIDISSPDSEIIDQWYAEPVRAFFIHTTAFKLNKRSYPVLSPDLQSILMKYMESPLKIIVSTTSPSEKIIDYIQFLWHTIQSLPELTEIEQASAEYADYLQSPLQPLQDHLESATYEVFERDPVKYDAYEDAIYQALLTRTDSEDVSLMVVGAGRGPLVQNALNASKRANKPIKVFAVEKNPSAVTILHHKNSTQWSNIVTIVHADMRFFTPESRVDILVSELLGSFGDNELSPECLDIAVERCLKPASGLCIPRDYTSFIAPISSTKLSHEIMNLGIGRGGKEDVWESGYVVNIKRAISLADPVSAFTFVHDLSDSSVVRKNDNSHNARYCKRVFKITSDSIVSGFVGYFESTLYNTAKLSILPSTHSPNMFSWFPIFFPLRNGGVSVSADDSVEIDIWRVAGEGSGKVWYEWAVSVVGSDGKRIVEGAVHNAGGKGSFIGL